MENFTTGALTETSLLILLSLFRELHGYGVKLDIEDKTGGLVSLGIGTLYGAINNLRDKGWIRESSQDGRRINYIITESGKEVVRRERVRLDLLSKLIDNVMGEDYEEV